MKKFAFYVSSKATRLKNFLSLYGSVKLCKSIDFILIDNQDNIELKKICDKKDITYYEVDITEMQNMNSYISNLLFKYLKQYNTNYAFVFADRILKGELLVAYKDRLINFHPSILPSHKGLRAIDKALDAGTFLLGNTAHIITNELDGGAIVMQNIFPSYNFKNYDEVLDKQLIMLLQIMHWIQDSRLQVNAGKVEIANAFYKVQEFIPNLEINYES